MKAYCEDCERIIEISQEDWDRATKGLLGSSTPRCKECDGLMYIEDEDFNNESDVDDYSKNPHYNGIKKQPLIEEHIEKKEIDFEKATKFD